MVYRALAPALMLFCIFSFPASADDCDVKAAMLMVAEPGLTARRLEGPGSPAIVLATPFASDATIDCATSYGAPLGLSVSWDGPYPPAPFYSFIARAGHIVIGASESDIRDGAMKCQQRALAAADESAQLIHKGAYLECQAFSRYPGATSISVYSEQAAPASAKE